MIICTADHHHAFIANWALNRNMHVYCEKPLGISVEETRMVRANYLSKRAKLATQHGTQRHAYPNFERMRELILDGAIGELKTVHGWDARQLPRPGYPAGEGQPPSFLHYEQWIGPSPYHPYSPQYFGGTAGLNCLFWNMYRDFGVGQMGDMGAHTMDLLWNAIDAGAPIAIDIDREVSDKFDPNITPVKLKAIFDHPANSLARAGAGGVVSGRPEAEPAARAISTSARVGNGAIFEGTKGSIFADFTSRIIIPNNDDGDLTYYKRRGKRRHAAADQRHGPGDAGRRAAAAPAAAGGGGVASGAPGQAPGGAARRDAARCPAPKSDANGFPVVQLMDGSTARPRPSESRVEHREAGRPTPADDVFQLDWIDACKGKSNNVVHGISSQDPLRLRLQRHDDRADAAGPGRAPGGEEAGVRSGDGASRIDSRRTIVEADVSLGLELE